MSSVKRPTVSDRNASPSVASTLSNFSRHACKTTQECFVTQHWSSYIIFSTQSTYPSSFVAVCNTLFLSLWSTGCRHSDHGGLWAATVRSLIQGGGVILNNRYEIDFYGYGIVIAVYLRQALVLHPLDRLLSASSIKRRAYLWTRPLPHSPRVSLGEFPIPRVGSDNSSFAAYVGACGGCPMSVARMWKRT